MAPRPPGQSVQAQIYQVTPDFFAAVGTRMVAGRDFTEADHASTRQLAIVNETFARQVIGTDPAMAIGKRFREGRRPVDVIGVVESGKYQTLSEAPRPAYFRLRTQDRTSSIALVLRSTVAPAAVVADARQLIGRLDPRVPLMGEGTYRQAAAITFIPSQVAAASLGTFGLLAILLAVVGVYGTAAYSVSSRWREIGIRIAVGARSNDVLRTVLGRTAIAVIAGGTAGVSGGVLASDLCQGGVSGIRTRPHHRWHLGHHADAGRHGGNVPPRPPGARHRTGPCPARRIALWSHTG